MGGGGKGGGGGASTYDYYGSIAGAICIGQIDSILAILVDSKIVWPKEPEWKSGESISIYALRTHNGAVYQALQSHTTSGANEPPNSSFWTRYQLVRPAAPTWTAGTTFQQYSYCTFNGTVYQALQTHTASVANQPPSATYWAASQIGPQSITVPEYGTAYLYWGTDTQTLDTVSEKVLSDNGHPPYRRQAILVLRNFYFGRERNAAPNVEVIVRRAPQQSAIPLSSSAAYLGDGQANPVGALVDLYTNPVYGAGLTLDSVGGPDSTTAAATANALITEANQTWISPILQQAKTLRQFTADVLAYFDGWMRFSKSGEIEFGKFPHNTAAPVFTPANTIDFSDLIDEITYSAEGFASTYNQTQVKFNDRERSFKDSAVNSVSGWNIAVTGEPRTAKIDRPWITRRQQASDHAAEWQKIYSEPKVSGSLVVRAEKAETILPGDLFLLTHDDLSVSMVCRCMGKDIAQPPAGRVTIRFETDRASSGLPYQPTPAASSGIEYPDAEQITLYQFFQPPAGMIEGAETYSLCALMARTSALTTGATVYLQQEDKSAFYELEKTIGFAVHGTLSQSYNPTMTRTTSTRARSANVATVTTPSAHGLMAGMTVKISGLGGNGFNFERVQINSVPTDTSFTYTAAGANVGTTTDTGGTIDPFNDDVSEDFRFTLNANSVSADVARILSATQTEDAINDRRIYVMSFDYTDTTKFEIFTLRAAAVTSGVYRLKLRRQEFGSAKRTGATGDLVWIGYRSDLVPLQPQQFIGAVAENKNVTFRIQSQNGVNTADLADTTICPNIAFAFSDPYKPEFVFESVRKDGVEITDFSVHYETDDVWNVSGKITDKSGNITDSSVYALDGAIKLPIWINASEPVAEVRFATRFVLPSVGTWQVFAEARDSSGRIVRKQLTAAGVPNTPVTIQIRQNSQAATPTASPVGQVFPQGTAWPKSVTLATATAGASIDYEIVDVGAISTGTWTTIAATSGTVSVALNKRVYARAHTSGQNYSSIVFWDYTQAWNTLRPSGGTISTTAV